MWVIGMADKIKIVPADFIKTATELRRVEGLLNEYKTTLSSNYSMMASSWQGVAGGAFQVCAKKILKSFEINISNINQLAMDIERASQFMEESDRNIAGTITGV